MSNKTILFDFSNMSSKSSAAKKAIQYFARAGENVVSVGVVPQIKRTAGVTYRELTLGFADSQTLTFRIKVDGDVYQVLLNGKAVPVLHQDDQVAAVIELCKMMNAGRNKFQQKLAKAMVKLPPTIRTAAPKMLQILTEKRGTLKSAIADIRDEIAQIRGNAA